MHDKTVMRAYLLEMLGAFVVYAALLVATIKYGRPMAEGTLRTVVLMAPMIGFFLVVWALARHLKRADEYQRQFALENIAIAAAMTAGLSFSYGFLETAGYEKLSMFTVWCVLCGTWGVATCGRSIMSR